MNILSSLQALGVRVRLGDEGRLVVSGLDRLTRERAEAALSLARRHKAALLAELRGSTPPLPSGTCTLRLGGVSLEVEHRPACKLCAALKGGPKRCDWPPCPIFNHVRSHRTLH